MNKKLWVGIYVASFVLCVCGVLASVFYCLLENDAIVDYRQAIHNSVVIVGILSYIQFAVVATVYNLATLFIMWRSIQDRETSISPGKAIGLLFVPFFNLYWVFKAWGSYPFEYNEFTRRNGLGVPMLSSRAYSMFPLLLLLGSFFIVPLLLVPVVFSVLLARTASAINNIKIAEALKSRGETASANVYFQFGRSRAFPLTMVGTVAVTLIIGILTFVALSNLHPTPTADELPQQVAAYKLQDSNSLGTAFGLRRTYNATYAMTSAGARKRLHFWVNRMLADGMAVRHIGLPSYFYDECDKDEKRRQSDLADKTGAKVGELVVCSSGAKLRNHNYLMSVSRDYQSQDPISEDEFVQFLSAMPLNANLQIGTKLGVAGPDSNNNAAPSPNVANNRNSSADIKLTAVEFYSQTNGSNRESGNKKFSGRTVLITGRFYDHSAVGGDDLWMHAGSSSTILHAEIDPAAASDLKNIKNYSLITVKCSIKVDFEAAAKSCVLVEDHGVLNANDTPDFTFTAKQLYDMIANYRVNASTAVKNAEKFEGKIIKVSGKVQDIGGKKYYLAINESEWLTCNPDDENKESFSRLAPGQTATFLGIGGSTQLEHCVVAQTKSLEPSSNTVRL